MFWGAHFVVKFVMLGLLAASVWCWAIIFDKTPALLAAASKSMNRFEEVFWSGQSLEELYRTLADRQTTQHGAPSSSRRCASGSARFERLRPRVRGPAQRIDKVMDVTHPARGASGSNPSSCVLATIGSSAPVHRPVRHGVGHHDVVPAPSPRPRTPRSPSSRRASPKRCSPPRIGLFAAIPAVIAYNKLQAEAAKQQARLEGFADEFSAILSRQIDERIAA